MLRIDTVVIGAGQAGLTASRALQEQGHAHVVLERGEVGDSWRRHRWDSLTLLTPAWLNRLPGWPAPDDPDAFPSAGAFAAQLRSYATALRAPVLPHTTVLELRPEAFDSRHRYRITTDSGTWLARNVVLAPGPGARARVPAALAALAADIDVVAASAYRNPRALRPGAVLVVGASSSGVQIADELHTSGRRVLLAAGRHTRVPRRYRGMDIYWWLHRTGRLDRSIDEVPDPAVARREASLQIVGRDPAHDVDLAALARRGIELLGHWVGAQASRARFADDLATSCADSDRRLRLLLSSIDAHIRVTGLQHEMLAPDPPTPFLPTASRTELDLRAEGVSTVVLATGHRQHLPWLKVPVLAADGAIRQRHGVTAAPGLYTVGQRFQARRSSGLIAGASQDAAEVVAHIMGRDTALALRTVRPEGAQP